MATEIPTHLALVVGKFSQHYLPMLEAIIKSKIRTSMDGLTFR